MGGKETAKITYSRERSCQRKIGYYYYLDACHRYISILIFRNIKVPPLEIVPLNNILNKNRIFIAIFRLIKKLSIT